MEGAPVSLETKELFEAYLSMDSPSQVAGILSVPPLMADRKRASLTGHDQNEPQAKRRRVTSAEWTIEGTDEDFEELSETETEGYTDEDSFGESDDDMDENEVKRVEEKTRLLESMVKELTNQNQKLEDRIRNLEASREQKKQLQEEETCPVRNVVPAVHSALPMQTWGFVLHLLHIATFLGSKMGRANFQTFGSGTSLISRHPECSLQQSVTVQDHRLRTFLAAMAATSAHLSLELARNCRGSLHRPKNLPAKVS